MLKPRKLKGEGSSSSKSNIGGVSVSPVLNRVSSGIANPPPPNDTLYQIIEIVLKSNEERSRREIKSIVLNLLRETCVQMCPQTLDSCCRTCLNSLLSLFMKVTDPESETTSGESDSEKKKIALEADNISWLLEILADRQGVDEFAVMLLSWLASFLKAGDNNCPNLQRAFQVWWRRTFIHPYVEESHSAAAAATATTTLLDPPA